MKEQKEPQLEVVKDEIKTEKDPARKPTDEEVEQMKKDFSDAMSEFERTKWPISEPGNFGANDVGIFLLEFMDKYAHWTKTEWMGLIKMKEEIKKSMGLADKDAGLAFGYQALEFCAYMLSNPGGTGMELAEEFEKQADKYSKIGIVVGAQVEAARKKLKEIHYLQDRYLASLQGAFLEDIMEKKEEEKIEVEVESQTEIKKEVEEKLEKTE